MKWNSNAERGQNRMRKARRRRRKRKQRLNETAHALRMQHEGTRLQPRAKPTGCRQAVIAHGSKHVMWRIRMFAAHALTVIP